MQAVSEDQGFGGNLMQQEQRAHTKEIEIEQSVPQQPQLPIKACVPAAMESKLAPPRDAIVNAEWTCAACTLFDSSTSTRCEVCGRLRGGDGFRIVQQGPVVGCGNELEPPDGSMCPITDDVMADPVIFSDGHSYERWSIEHWLVGHNTSPLTAGAELGSKQLIPNHALRKVVQEWEQNNKRRL